jgi:hypothetical protein
LRWGLRWRGLAALCFVVGCSAGWGQTLSEREIKAGFLFNFTRFVDWPEAAFAGPGAPYVLCIAGDASMTRLLRETAAGKVVNGRGVVVREVKGNDDGAGCHVVFLSGTDGRRGRGGYGGGILTVGESPGFARGGGVMDLVLEENRVKVELNLGAAERAGLRVSAKLIAVSRLVAGAAAAGGN